MKKNQTREIPGDIYMNKKFTNNHKKLYYSLYIILNKVYTTEINKDDYILVKKTTFNVIYRK